MSLLIVLTEFAAVSDHQTVQMALSIVLTGFVRFLHIAQICTLGYCPLSWLSSVLSSRTNPGNTLFAAVLVFLALWWHRGVMPRRLVPVPSVNLWYGQVWVEAVATDPASE